MTHPAGERSAQRGAALLTAMIIVTLIATMSATMVWQQWRAVQIEAVERARTQSAWLLSGGLDFARFFLREDRTARNGGPVSLKGAWATPLQEAKLSSFLAVDKSNVDDAPEVFLAGSITDAQARYNLRNLVDADGKIVAAEVSALGKLFDSIGVAPDLAATVATGMRDATARPGSPGLPENAPLMPQNVAQLAWFGLPAASLRLMQPFVVLLPRATPVNLNTAPREVLAAAIDGLTVGGAERLVEARTSRGAALANLQEAKNLLPGVTTLDARRVGVSSNFFFVQTRIRLEDRVLEEQSLVETRGLEIVPLQRRRISSRDPAG